MRKIRNRTKPNNQLFIEYYTVLETTRPQQQSYENTRVLKKFHIFIGEFPPTPEMAIQFVASYKNRSISTRARILYTLKGFYRYSGLGEIPIKIKEPNRLPPNVDRADINKLLEALSNKKTHKGCSERDIVLIRTAIFTGLRRGELSNLKVRDITIRGEESYLVVRSGKGDKDRIVPLYWEIRDELAHLMNGKLPEDSVFNLSSKSISMKILQWAVKAGVPNIHTHSFRHYFVTTLFHNKANPRDIQRIAGHTSLETTMKYAGSSDKGLREAINTFSESEHPPPEIDHAFAL